MQNRRMSRFKRRSTRNASGGPDSNEPREKPSVNQSDGLGPRKPEFRTPKEGTPTPPPVKDPSKVAGVKTPKPSFVPVGRPKNDTVKLLLEFNDTVNALMKTGEQVAMGAGGVTVLERLRLFNAAMNLKVEQEQQEKEGHV